MGSSPAVSLDSHIHTHIFGSREHVTVARHIDGAAMVHIIMVRHTVAC